MRDMSVRAFPASMGSAEIADFQYRAPASLNELRRVLRSIPRRSEVKFIAGGMSLIPTMKLGLVSPSFLIDLNQTKDLKGWTLEGRSLRVGSMARYSDILEAKRITRLFPELEDCISQIGDMQVRNRGTIGGALAHGDPSGDLSSCMIALGAVLKIKREKGSLDKIPVEEFFKGFFSTSLGARDVLTEVEVPLDSKLLRGGSYLKLERTAGDFATVGVGVSLWFEKRQAGTSARRIVRAGIGLTSAGDRPLKGRRGEKLLVGSPPSEELFGNVSSAVAEETDPSSDVRGDKEFKKQMFRVFAKRALIRSTERAGLRLG